MTYKYRVPIKGENLDEPAPISQEEILKLNPECSRDQSSLLVTGVSRTGMHSLTFKGTPSSHPIKSRVHNTRT